jgi:hypothetical protein
MAVSGKFRRNELREIKYDSQMKQNNVADESSDELDGMRVSCVVLVV